MKQLRIISKHIRHLIKRKPGVEDGIRRIIKTLHGSFRFYDVRLVNRQQILKGCLEFRDWLNQIIISQPPPEDLAAVYFGLFSTEEGLHIYASGSKIWREDDPDWACRSDWRPEGRVLMPELFREITKVYSEYNDAGCYISLAYTVLMILDFARESMVSLLDDKRRSMYIACGFDDGELFNLGVILEGGVISIGEAARRRLLPKDGLR
jgi:hypothetical protein